MFWRQNFVGKREVCHRALFPPPTSGRAFLHGLFVCYIAGPLSVHIERHVIICISSRCTRPLFPGFGGLRLFHISIQFSPPPRPASLDASVFWPVYNTRRYTPLSAPSLMESHCIPCLGVYHYVDREQRRYNWHRHASRPRCWEHVGVDPWP